MRSFGQWITTFSFDWLRELESPDNMVDALQDVLSQAYQTHFPLVVTKRKCNDEPWISDRILSLMKTRQRAFHSGNRELFQLYRNRV